MHLLFVVISCVILAGDTRELPGHRYMYYSFLIRRPGGALGQNVQPKGKGKWKEHPGGKKGAKGAKKGAKSGAKGKGNMKGKGKGK